MGKICYICKEKLENKDAKGIVKIEIIFTTQVNMDVLNLNYSRPKNITTIFHNGSSYGYHFIL